MKALTVLFLSLALLGESTHPTAPKDRVRETPGVPFNEYFYNPLLNEANDPWVVGHDGFYYYCRRANGQIEITRSPTLTGIPAHQLHEGSVRRVPVGEGQTQVWAPELHYYRGLWYILYTASYDGEDRLHRMYILRSETGDPMGAWGEPTKLELPKDQWAIDGTLFEDEGRLFIIWSGWKSEAEGLEDGKQNLYIGELDAQDPARVLTTRRVMIGEPRHKWETSARSINEGPAILRSPVGTVYCMFSGNHTGSNAYTVGAIRWSGRDALNAGYWRKLPEPVLASNPETEIYSPGHASFVKSPDGREDWMLFHTARHEGAGFGRNGRLARVEWVDDTPTVDPLPSTEARIPLPSGEVVDRFLMQAEDAALPESATVLEGYGETPMVRLTGAAGEDALFTVSVPQAGLYALTVRYTCPMAEQATLWLRARESGGEARLTAYQTAWTREGNKAHFAQVCGLLTLRAGANTIELSGGEGLAFDLVILDRTPLETL